MSKQKADCLAPHCPEKGSRLGLCIKCYQTARRLVLDGKTTWEALEQQGKTRRKNSSPNAKNKTAEWLLSPTTDQ